SCGKEHIEEAKFCPNCGAFLGSDSGQQKNEIGVKLSGQSAQSVKNESEMQFARKPVEANEKIILDTKNDHSDSVEDVKESSKAEKKPKKKFVLISVILLLIVLSVYFVFRFDNENREKEFKFEKGDEVSVVKQEQSNLVYNQTQNYSFETPNTWFTEETIAPVSGVAVFNESGRCKIHTGFIRGNTQSIDELVKFSTEYSGATINVKDFTLIGKYKGKKMLHTYGKDPVVRYIAAYADVEGKMFSLSSGGEQCDNAEGYFNRIIETIKFE
ncbi:MAG: zinc ribbon domain-containing protein, partial [Candidatus Gracilibacteria bacterium]